MISKKDVYNNLVVMVLAILPITGYSQTIMFDDFTYTSINDSQLSTFNKWGIINGTSGPPEGGQYSRNNVSFVNDPDNTGNRLVTLSTTVKGQTKASTHSRIETSGFDYFEGTYSARVYFSDLPYVYKDANIQTFYTIVSSSLGPDGSRYSELDFEYMAADKWGISADNKVLYLTAWNRYIADPWQAWKRYIADQRSFEGWHIFTVSCTDGVNVKFWIDEEYIGSMATTDNDGSSVYPRNPMQVAFANWIWNNETGSNTADRTTTMKVDWVLFYKDQEVNPQQVQALVADYRSQGLQRRNLAGNTYVTDPNQPPSVNITSPANGTVFNTSASISINANASDPDGSITQVEFYNGSSFIGVDYTSPYSTEWQNVSVGSYAITAKATDNQGVTATSSVVNITVQEDTPNGSNLGLNKSVVTSSNETNAFTGSLAVDGSETTRWSSTYNDPEWIYIDLENSCNITQVILRWETAYASSYEIQVSDDILSWTTIYITTNGNGGIDNITNLNGTGRYIRMYGTSRGSEWGYSLWEFEVYGTPDDGENPEAFSLLIEAEDYSNMSGVQLEATQDEGNGQSVGYIDTEDWMVYNGVTIPSSDYYLVEYRVASLNGGGQLSLDFNAGATVLGTLNIPSTGGWQNWTTVSHIVYLEAGTYAFGLYAQSGGWNINWFRITQESASRVTGNDAEKLPSTGGILLFPNPAFDELKIYGLQENAIIRIYDLSGNLQLDETIKQTDKTIRLDIGYLKPGVYVLEEAGKAFRFMKK